MFKHTFTTALIAIATFVLTPPRAEAQFRPVFGLGNTGLYPYGNSLFGSGYNPSMYYNTPYSGFYPYGMSGSGYNYYYSYSGPVYYPGWSVGPTVQPSTTSVFSSVYPPPRVRQDYNTLNPALYSSNVAPAYYPQDPPPRVRPTYSAQVAPVLPNLPIVSNVPRTSAGTSAVLDVVVPTADAEVWFEGVKTRLTGTERQFVSPPLVAGSKYGYEVRVHWLENGQLQTETRNVVVRAGDRLRVDFTKRAGS